MISVLIPSRGRPNELQTSLNSLGLVEHGLEALIWLDEDDPKLEQYQELFGSKSNIRLFVKQRVGYSKFYLMVNFLIEQAKYDWYFLFNDDLYMINPDWFKIFEDFVKLFKPTVQPIAINIWGQGNKANLFPIVSRKYCDICGHFSLSVACDDWVRIVSTGANIVYDLYGIKPKHRKYVGDDILKDKTYEEVEAERVKSEGKWDP